MRKNIIISTIILVSLALVIVAGCASTQSNDPVVGAWSTSSGSLWTFTANGQYQAVNSERTETISGNWTKIKDGEYQVTAGQLIGTYIYNSSEDTLISSISNAKAVRFTGQNLPTLTTVSASPTSVITAVATASLTASHGSDPIVGTYTCDAGSAGYGQVTFNADGTFVEYFNLAGKAPVQATGTWQYNNGVYLTALTTGATNVWVITPSGAVKDENALIYVPGTEHGKVQVTQTTSGSGGSKVTSFKGYGDDVQSFTATGDGMRIFSMSYSGESNFIIWLEDSQGNKLDLLVNEIGSYNGKTSERMGPGTYYLDVSASGPWTVTLTSI
ncbi:hypothetical protein [Methanoregula sp. UBA64]|jgi:hypothetical protein|uniref:hypothetical protein n=1 Tax=Methanoregula sp. UBA64 TaxID=1915554 RepID=UPI0025EC2A6C|nr:hypothetical protein [Methanoregula sp. UBA64]